MKDKTTSNPIKKFLGFTSFKAPIAGIFFKISFITILYSVLIPVLKAAGMSDFLQLSFWFLICGGIAYFDYKFLGASQRAFAETYRLQQKSQFSEAISLLKSTSSPKELAPCPNDIFFPRLIELQIAKGDIEESVRTLDKLKDYPELSLQKEIYTLKISEANHGAKEALSEVSNLIEEPEYKYEKALLLLKAKDDYPQLKKVLKEILKEPNNYHASSNLHDLSNALLEVSNLWTGRAEKGLENLSLYINIFQKNSILNPALKEFLGLLYIERAYYLATHKEPHKALSDISLAKLISSHSYIKERIEECEEELLWRHDIIPASEDEADINQELKELAGANLDGSQ